MTHGRERALRHLASIKGRHQDVATHRRMAQVKDTRSDVRVFPRDSTDGRKDASLPSQRSQCKNSLRSPAPIHCEIQSTPKKSAHPTLSSSGAHPGVYCTWRIVDMLQTPDLLPASFRSNSRRDRDLPVDLEASPSRTQNASYIPKDRDLSL